MANSSYRTCLVCGKKYRFCHSCSEYETWPMWYNLFHDENCHEIWYTLCDFESGKLTKEEAQKKFEELDASIIINESASQSYKKLFYVVDSPESTTLQEDAPASVEEPVPVEEPKKEETPVEPKEEHLSISEEIKKKNNYHYNKNKKN